MRLVMIGSGYVGLVSGACFSEMGHDVVCVDNDEAKIEALRSGDLESLAYEPGLDEMIRLNSEHGRLSFLHTDDAGDAVARADFVFLCVPTPTRESDPDGACNTDYIFEATKWAIGFGARAIVTKSTVPPGTNVLLSHMAAPIPVFSNPEFLAEGSAIRDFMYPDRVVVGCLREPALADELASLYRPLLRNGPDPLVVNLAEAELVKLCANAMLATKISFANGMAQLCGRLGADVEKVRRGVAADHRVGKHFLFPGMGFGGSCFGKDVRSLAYVAKAADPMSRFSKLLSSVVEQNEEMPWTIKCAIDDYFQSLVGKRQQRVALWGLAFKPNTDDIRDAPALKLARLLHEAGYEVHAHDPKAMNNVAKAADYIKLHDDAYAAAANANVLVLCTEWHQYRFPDWDYLSRLLQGVGSLNALVVDGRNQWDLSQVQLPRHLAYVGVGR